MSGGRAEFSALAEHHVSADPVDMFVKIELAESLAIDQ